MGTSQPEKMASVWSVRPTPALRRTEWAEHHVEEILSIPFVSEFVFQNVRTTEGRKEEQVADFLIFHRAAGLLVEQKCQEDPTSRTGPKLALWARKAAKEGCRQIRRALTRRVDFPVRCDHRRRGRVEFPGGLPPIQHGIVTVEVVEPIDLPHDAKNLPLDYRGTPITYLSVNDFLNLAVQLRSLPELMDYLAARRSLPQASLRRIGDERPLLHFYLLNDGSFAGITGQADAREAIAAQHHRLQDALRRKYEADKYAFLLEHVADELAVRNPEVPKDVPRAFLAAYDPADRRKNYLEVQAALADLRLRERVELGRGLQGAIDRAEAKGLKLTFRAGQFDSMPEWAYIVAASRNVTRAELLPQMMALLGGAMAFYGKPKCIVIVARDDGGYEVALSRPDANPTQTGMEEGKCLFGRLRVENKALSFLPEN